MSELNLSPPPSQELLDRTPPKVLAYLVAHIEYLTKRVEAAEARAEAAETRAEAAEAHAEAAETHAEAAEARAEAAEARVLELEQRLKLTSQNSSKPPSSDPPGISKRPRGRPKKKRKRGGQPGHKGHKRELLPVEEVDELVKIVPETCEGCGRSLVGLENSKPERHQVTELPPVKPIVTEYQFHHLDCPACGTHNHAQKPPGVPSGMFGPSLVTLVALLTGQYQLTKRLTVRLMQDFFGIKLSLGSISRMERIASEALAQPVAEVACAIKNESRVHADETGMKQKKKKGWLWVFLTESISLFVLRATRGAKVVKEVLGSDFSGILYSDRWSAYSWLPGTRRQFCWAHLIRDFESFKLRNDESARLGELLLHQSEHLFYLVHRVRDGTLSQTIFKKRVRQIRREVMFRLEQGGRCAHTKRRPRSCDCQKKGKKCVTQKAARLCRRLVDDKESMWVFLDEELLELTNNAAERAIRPAVIYRKRSFGIEGEGGCRFFERMMSTVTTLRLQERHVLGYVTEAVQAHFRGELPPSLLPPHEPTKNDPP